MKLAAELDQLLRELETEGQRNDAQQTDRKKKFLNLERPTAELIYVLLQASRRKQILEIGTSTAFSTIWIAAALKDCSDAKFISVEISPEKLALARKNLARAGFSNRVELLEGNATDVVAGLKGPFDCVFFDADRVSAPAQLAAAVTQAERRRSPAGRQCPFSSRRNFGLQGDGRAIAGFHLHVDAGGKRIAHSLAERPDEAQISPIKPK